MYILTKQTIAVLYTNYNFIDSYDLSHIHRGRSFQTIYKLAQQPFWYGTFIVERVFVLLH